MISENDMQKTNQNFEGGCYETGNVQNRHILSYQNTGFGKLSQQVSEKISGLAQTQRNFPYYRTKIISNCITDEI